MDLEVKSLPRASPGLAGLCLCPGSAFFLLRGVSGALVMDPILGSLPLTWESWVPSFHVVQPQLYSPLQLNLSLGLSQILPFKLKQYKQCVFFFLMQEIPDFCLTRRIQKFIKKMHVMKKLNIRFKITLCQSKLISSFPFRGRLA